MRILFLASMPHHRKSTTRVDGLRAAGAHVVMAGYVHDGFKDPAATHDYIVLGHARGGAPLARALAAPLYLKNVVEALRGMNGCDVIWATTLDLLALARAARAVTGSKARLLYDVTDLKPWPTQPGLKGSAFRAFERFLCGALDALTLSSPYFYWSYYKDIAPRAGTVFLLENKLSSLPPRAAPASGPPWRIVWHGLLRCPYSLRVARDLCARLPQTVEIHCWGQAYEGLQGALADAVAALPNFHHHGPYSDSAIDPVFDGAHFIYAFDMNDGLNSKLLLPNRLYHAAGRALPMLSIAGSAIAEVAAAKRLGPSFAAPFAQTLADFFEALTPERYAAMAAEITEETRARAVYDRDFIDILAGLERPAPASPRVDASVVLSADPRLA